MTDTSAEAEKYTDVPDEPVYMVGQLVLDTGRNHIGTIMEAHWGLLWLRPPGGGCEWECARDDVRPLRDGELDARLRKADDEVLRWLEQDRAATQRALDRLLEVYG